MGLHKQPTAKLKLHGVFRKDRHGDRAMEPQPIGKVLRPREMSRDAIEHWKSIVPGLVKTGVATTADISALVQMCEWWAEWKRAKNQRIKDRPRVMSMSMAFHNWRDLASRFGMTPSDRANLTVTNKDKHDPAADFIA